jgi:predicted hotdog family 3-hydroxylacyl-ACP dehydratase
MSAVEDLGRERLLQLIPHAGSMCLLDRVVGYSDEEIRCVSRSHRDPANPLRRQGRLSALHLAEYAAQAMAAHGALLAGGRAQPGMLAALREVHLHVSRIDDIDGQLSVHAIRRLAQSRGFLYDFTVHANGQLLSEGRIAIALL